MTVSVSRTATHPKHTISAVLIVKNEERKLAACLESLRWVDEIIVLDGGSDDRSREIAQAAGARVEVRTDWNGFGVQRGRAEALATSDWILAIDADERRSEERRVGKECRARWTAEDGKERRGRRCAERWRTVNRVERTCMR